MIIYFETTEIQLRDIPRVLEGLGYPVRSMDLHIEAQGFYRNTCDKIIEVLRQEKPECVISYNFIENISQACMEADVPYISWVYDNPQQELYTQYAQYPNNYIFVFDRQQQRRLKQVGVRKVYHMPLAIDGDKVRRVLQQGEKYAGQYEAEIAFVGQLYRIESLEQFIERADFKVQTAMEESIAGCFLRWNAHIRMHGAMSNDCVQYFSAIDGHKVGRFYPYASEQFYYEAAVVSRILANKERVAILNELAEQYDVRFYTFDADVSQLSNKVKVCPGAKYDSEVSCVYRQSKINLNITLHCIETGLSQRVFDVMAAGGFLLTNYQEELEELFVIGEDLVVYYNMEELQYYVAYYLAHEEERLRIARNGQEKVLKYHDFRVRMPQVLELVRETEDKRRERYTDIWNREKPISDMMLELARCRDIERKIGTQQIFQGIESLEDAQEKYFDTWMKLSEITANCEELLYKELCLLLIDKKIPVLYPVWYLYVKKQDKEAILLKLTECMKQYNMALAIELVSYGLLMTPAASALLLKKAECLMEVSMWQEALQTLKQIREPQEDILLLIQELEQALGI